MDEFEALQDLFVIQQVELEAVRMALSGAGGKHAVEVEGGAGVVPGLGQAQGHDEHPRLGGLGHVVLDRLAAAPHNVERGRGHQRVQVRVEPLVVAHIDEAPLGEGLAMLEGPLQLVADRPDHIAVEQGVRVGLEAGVRRRLEPGRGDVVAFLDQLLFDVACETRADGEDRLALADLE